MADKFIQETEHQPKQPVTIERAEHDVIIIEGVRYSADYFRTMAVPNPKYLYAIKRVGDQVWLTEIHNEQEALGFFFLNAYKPGGA